MIVKLLGNMQSETLCHFMPNIWKSSLLIIPTPGQNGHRFRREESVAIQPALSALLKAYQEKNEIDEDAYRQVAEECRKIIVAADGLLASGNENRPLITEISLAHSVQTSGRVWCGGAEHDTPAPAEGCIYR